MRLRPAGQASLVFVFATIAIDSIGLGIIIPVLPDVIRRFLSDEAEVSRLYGYFVAIYALMQLFASPLLGRLSDRYGRRPILLLSLFGAAIDYLFMAFAPTLPLLFLGRVIAGITGASYTVASAYIADISTDENRSKNFGAIGAGFGLGFIIGPAIGGLLGSYGPEYAFLAAAAFNLLNFLFGLFVLPESLPPEKRRTFTLRGLNPLSSIASVFRLAPIRALLLVHVFMQLAGQTHPSVWTLSTEYRYGWTAKEVGVSLAVVGILSAISQGFLTGVFVKRFGERRLLSLGTLGEAVSYAFFGYAPTGAFLYVVLVVSSLIWACHPALQSIISREVPPECQGELQGSLMSLTSLVSIVNPILMTSLFAHFTHASRYEIPGAPYYLGAIVLFVAWVLVLRWERAHPL